MNKLYRPRGVGWLVVLAVAGLGLLAAASPYVVTIPLWGAVKHENGISVGQDGILSHRAIFRVGRSRPASETPPASITQPVGNSQGLMTAGGEPGLSAPFLRDYEALMLDQADIPLRSPTINETLIFLAKFGLILVLLYSSLRALRSFMLRQQGATSTATQIEILETRYLSSNRALYVVGAGPKILLLGGTDQQITFLAELEDGGWKEENGGQKGENGGWMKGGERKGEVGNER